MTARQLTVDFPILDHSPGGPVAGLSSILTIVKRDYIITEGHGGGPMVMVTETASAAERDDYRMTEGHGGGPIIMATETPSASSG